MHNSPHQDQARSASAAHDHLQGVSPDTLVVAAGRPAPEHDAPVSPGITLTSTYRGIGPEQAGDRLYGRTSNPTWEHLEEVLARLEGAECPATLVASGLAAVSAVAALVPVGGTVVVPAHAYMGSVALLRQAEQEGRLHVRAVDVADTAAVEQALPGADLAWLESPTNPLLEVADLPAVLSAARAAGVLTCVDNTFATPLLQTPLALGADLVVHSATKYLSGHSDVLLGAVLTSDPQLHARIRTHRQLHGAVPGPFEAWAALRGVRTLGLRVRRACASAQVLAERLQEHPAVASVAYPGLPQDPGHPRAAAQLRGGFGAVIAITVHGGAEQAERVVRALRLWVPATSLGGVESLIERRRRHHDEPASVPESLLRLSVGIEDVEDLWRDLAAGLDTVVGRT